MAEEKTPYDVVIVGASIAGCTAATFFGRRGVKVLLLERASNRATYKKVCTHFIQPCGTPVLERLGLTEQIEAVGGVRNSADAYTPVGTVIHAIEEHGFNIRREKLDPMLRELAAITDGVELRLGTAVKSLIRERERIAGVVLDDGTEVRAPLVIGADGRHSKVAEMAGLTGTPAPNNRFFYFAYFEDLPLKTGERSQIWFLDPDVAYCFPNEDGLTCAAVMPHKDKLPAFKKDLEGSFLSMYAGIPNAPDFSKAKRIGEFLGMLELPNRIRPASTPGLALIGDAAVTSDPIFGVGCGWALQSAEWLTDDATEAILSRSEARIDEAITTYARHHGERLAMHHNLINGLSRAKPLNFLERSLFTAASRNREIAHQMGILTARLKHPKEVMTPGFVARVLWAARPRWLGGERGRARVAATS